MNKIIILTALFAIALAAPEPPVENTMEGLNIDPELLSRVVEIFASNTGGAGARSGATGRSGSQSYSAPQNSYSAPQASRSSYSAPPSQHQSGGFGGRSAGGAAGGSNKFEIDEIQSAPLVADFAFENSGAGGIGGIAGGLGRSNGGYNAPQAGGYRN